MNPKFEEQTSTAYFRALSIIHIALIIGLLLFLTTNFVIHLNDEFAVKDKTMDTFLIYMTPGIAIVASYLSFSRYKKSMANLSNVSDLKVKLGQYKLHYIAHLALLIGAGLFANIAYMISGTIWILGIGLIMAVVLWLVRPTKEKIAMDLALTHQEKMLLNDPNAVVAIVRVNQ